MLDFVELLASVTGLPVGIKSAVGDMAFWRVLAEAMRARGFDGRFHTLTAFRTTSWDVIGFLLLSAAMGLLLLWDRVS